MMSNGKEQPLTQSVPAAFHDHCNMEKKECWDNCTILYHLASNDLHKFSVLHQVFGACNVIKLIQDLPADKRVDAVNSMVYEANARLQDPALGCVGEIQKLQLQISDLQSEISTTQATIRKMVSQRAQLVACIPGFNDNANPRISTSLNEDDGKDEGLFDSDLED
eukprot:PITA_25489